MKENVSGCFFLNTVYIETHSVRLILTFLRVLARWSGVIYGVCDHVLLTLPLRVRRLNATRRKNLRRIGD